jgi:hypothetical protein
LNTGAIPKIDEANPSLTAAEYESKKKTQQGLIRVIFNDEYEKEHKERLKPRDFERSRWWLPDADKEST